VKTMKVIREVEVPGLEDRIRAARERYCRDNSISVAVFAVSLGMTPQNLYRIESGRQSLDEARLLKMEEILGVSFGVDFSSPYAAHGDSGVGDE